MNILNEEWRDCVGYEGLYQVSSLGRVRSMDRWIAYGDGRKRFYKGRVLKPSLNRDGYPVVNLGLGKSVRVHCIVAGAFIGDRPKGLDINHVDGCKANNHVSNLEYATRGQNICHAFANGLSIASRGELSGKALLTEAKVLEIRDLLSQGYTNRAVAKMFGVSKDAISHIRLRKTWKHI